MRLDTRGRGPHGQGVTIPIDIAAGMSRRDAVAALRRALAAAGLDTPSLDARLLGVDALGIGATALVTEPDVALSADEAARLAGFGLRRVAREPVARILGRAEFWSLPFRLSPETLVPRPDTETVVEAALALVPDRRAAIRVLDLGTGSGCLLVALLHELPGAWGLGLDRSAAALATARANAARNGVADRAAFAAGDWAAALAGRFDLVVSNPPYIATSLVGGLDPEVARHDPPRALDGGPDGLAAYRTILASAPALLAPDGSLVLEIGHDQHAALAALVAAAGLRIAGTARDLGGHVRALTVRC